MNKRQFLKLSAFFGLKLLFTGGKVLRADQHFTVPPEEAPHELTFMQWPVSSIVHPEKAFLSDLQAVIAKIANAISQFEPVVLLAEQRFHSQIRRLVSADIELWDIPTEDLWCRDSGPLFAFRPDGRRVVSHIRFNGWGGKQVHKKDGEITAKIAERLQIPLISSGLVGEAGGVEHDGHGLLMAHESSWVTKNRNPGMTRQQIEQLLLKAYGAERIIWSPGVWGQDITDYHIDSLARFTGPSQVLMNFPDDPDPDDPFHQAALETHDRLIAAKVDMTVIPEPYQRRVKHEEFVASYVNYYVCNGAVIAPQFGDKETDKLAHDALKRAYTNREIVTLNVDALGEVGGGIHCATQQLPKA